MLPVMQYRFDTYRRMNIEFPMSNVEPQKSSRFVIPYSAFCGSKSCKDVYWGWNRFNLLSFAIRLLRWAGNRRIKKDSLEKAC